MTSTPCFDSAGALGEMWALRPVASQDGVSHPDALVWTGLSDEFRGKTFPTGVKKEALPSPYVYTGVVTYIRTCTQHASSHQTQKGRHRGRPKGAFESREPGPNQF